VGFFDQNHTSELNKRYRALDELWYMAGHQVPTIIQCLLTLILKGGFMVHSNGYLGGTVVVLLMIQGGLERYLDKKLEMTWWAMQGAEHECNKVRPAATQRENRLHL
jgi:hypothetical protein